MSYSDYGGYGYRNGVRVEEASDVAIHATTGERRSTPGVYPGWDFPPEDGWSAHHVVLGAGPVYVKMHKQCVELVTGKGDNMCLSSDRLRSTSGHSWLAYTVDEYHATLVAAHEQRKGDTESNYYVYAELREPDGTIWAGFCGFGVGAGLETIPGFSTEARVKRLRWLFPDSFAAADAAPAAAPTTEQIP
jgi:hypothetical protein